MTDPARNPVDRAVAAISHRQRGYITREQLSRLGLDPNAIVYRVRIGRLIPAHHGVYAVGHLPVSPPDRAAAAVLACGPGAALSHASAAALWDFGRWRTPFHVTAPSNHRRPGIRVHRSTSLARRDLVRQLGIRATSPARTILDCAPALGGRRLTRMVNNARIANRLRLADLADVLERFPRHPGARALLPFVQAPTGPTRSEFEDAFLIFCRRYDLPRPLINQRLAGYEVDALFAAERVVVELDGWSFHSSRASFETDRDKDADLLVVGFATVRITWERLLSSPDAEAQRLRAILGRRRKPTGGGRPRRAA